MGGLPSKASSCISRIHTASYNGDDVLLWNQDKQGQYTGMKVKKDTH